MGKPSRSYRVFWSLTSSSSGTKYLTPLAVGTILYNLVDSPAGVIPVAHVDPSKDGLTDEWWASGGHGSKLLESRLYTGPDAIYNPEKMKGLPIGIQVVGRLWQDEKVVAIMKVIDDALGPRGFGPGTSPVVEKS
jgi:hypothetical protein